MELLWLHCEICESYSQELQLITCSGLYLSTNVLEYILGQVFFESGREQNLKMAAIGDNMKEANLAFLECPAEFLETKDQICRMVKFQFLRKQKVYNNQETHQNDFM